jgi:exopolyphosphatase/guanosine-5'-triphosphate,3'-diphosphate pyrophosphatase
MNRQNQGRLPDRQPVSIVDIGSNSIRLVVYEGIARSPTVLFNEKMLAGLGRNIVTTNRLDPQAVSSALAELRRFRALSEQAGAKSLYAIATAAAREAENGPDFIEKAEEILGVEINVLSGRSEAYFSGLGVISSFHLADGIAGDLGGGSLELIDVRGRELGDGITLPLGGLRLDDMAGGSVAKARKIVASEIGKADFLVEGSGRTFYAVGGTWRNLARLHMREAGYPLIVTHDYRMDPSQTLPFLKDVADGKAEKMKGIWDVSKNRRALLPYGAIVLEEIVKAVKPKTIAVSALGVREGFMYSLLSAQAQSVDPLISAAEELALLRSRSVAHARELADWTGMSFAAFGIDETEDEARYRRAACLVADIGWRAHPEYRGLQSLNILAHAAFIGVDHPGRAYVALTNLFRHEGTSRNMTIPELGQLADGRLFERARILGALMRVVYLFSASMPGVIPQLGWRHRDNGMLQMVLPAQLAGLAGERPSNRMAQLSRMLGKPLEIVVEN